MGLDDSDVLRARTNIADTFVTYVHVYNIDIPEVDGDIDFEMYHNQVVILL